VIVKHKWAQVEFAGSLYVPGKSLVKELLELKRATVDSLVEQHIKLKIAKR
jgi:hypothetical protein